MAPYFQLESGSISTQPSGFPGGRWIKRQAFWTKIAGRRVKRSDEGPGCFGWNLTLLILENGKENNVCLYYTFRYTYEYVMMSTEWCLEYNTPKTRCHCVCIMIRMRWKARSSIWACFTLETDMCWRANLAWSQFPSARTKGEHDHMVPPKNHMSNVKNLYEMSLYWLVHLDSYNGLF